MTKRSKNHELREFDESASRAFTINALQPKFSIYEEVWLRSPIGEKFRIDAIAHFPDLNYIFGLEFKPSHLKMSEFSDALRQCINYRDSYIEDERFSEINLKIIDCVFLSPDWDGLHENGLHDYPKQSEGMKVLAAHFRVGVVSRTQARDAVSLVIGKTGVWHSTTGWTQTAEGVVKGKRRRGSGTKRLDKNISH